MSWVDSCDDDYALDALKEEVADLKAENEELRKELAVNEPLFETLNDANDRLLAENAELRKERDALDRLTDILNDSNDGLLAENAELREIARTACKIADSLCELAPSCAKCACPDTTGGNCMLTQIERELFKLGVEV